jgi:hypothetical protein
MTPLQAAGGAAALRSAVGGKPSPRSAATSIARRKLEAQGRENLFKAGGGQAAISKGPTRNVRGGGTAPSLTRSDIEKRGASAATLKQSYEYDAYDVVLEYLLNNGHVDTVEEAHYVMMEMDAETIGNIVENRSMSYSGGKPGASGDGSRPPGIRGGKTYQMPGFDDIPTPKKPKVKGA